MTASHSQKAATNSSMTRFNVSMAKPYSAVTEMLCSTAKSM
ncbi:MAG: hypothetical protein R6U70_09405 [Bacillota bacterium]